MSKIGPDPLDSVKKCAADLNGVIQTFWGEWNRIDRGIWNNSNMNNVVLNCYLDAQQSILDSITYMQRMRCQMIIHMQDEFGIDPTVD